MRRARPAAARLAALWLLSSSACSLLVMRKAPDPVLEPDAPASCTASILPPLVDSVGMVTGGLYASLALAPLSMTGQERLLLGATGLLTAGVYGASSIAGWRRATRCTAFKELNARCVGGELDACRTLTPGWTATVARWRERRPGEVAAGFPPGPAGATGPSGPAEPTRADVATGPRAPDAGAPAPVATAPHRGAEPSRLGLGIRVGYARALGDVRREVAPTDMPDSHLPIRLDVTWALSPNVPAGVYLSWGPGRLDAEASRACDALGATCSATSVRFGLQGARVFGTRGARVRPWIGAGIGVERLSFEQSGEYASDFEGFELLAQGGAQFRVAPRLSVGPYLQISTGEFTSLNGRDVGSRAGHQWLELGVRASRDP